MFRQTGGVLGTSIIILALSHFEDKAGGLQQIFLVLSIVILVLIPLVFLIPDTARSKRNEVRDRDQAPRRAAVGPSREPR
jgi:hypothetical protein